jgi:arylsulfatase A-like enzyme
MAVPILTWIVLAVAILLIWTPICFLARLPLSLTSYAGALGFVGMCSVLIPWGGNILERLSAVGFEEGLYPIVALSIVVMGVASTTALLVAAVVHRYADTLSRGLPYLAVAVLSIAGLLLVPAVRFFLTDWKWSGEVSVSGAGERPNVVLISIDTLRADHLGSYGSPAGLTPNMDTLAAEGVTFRQTISTSPWTLPAMASVLTALHPRHHRAGHVTNRRDQLGRSSLPEATWTLAEELRHHGFHTHAIVTNPYLALSYGLGGGFLTYESVTIESEIFISFRHTTVLRLLTWLWPDIVTGDRGETVSARASAWLENLESDAPFFLWIHYIDPHPPYSARGIDKNKTFRTDSLFGGSREVSDFALRSPDIARLRSGEIRLGDNEKEMVRRLYRAEVHLVDAAVGAVLHTLDETGLSSDTLVALVADHGEEFWEHGGVEHGHTLYDELLLVPFILRWPEHLPKSTLVNNLVRIVDVAPTILDLLNVPIPDGLDGSSAVPLLSGREPTPRLALAENLLFAEERTAIRTSDHKYIRWEDGREEVYDLRVDPNERVNLVAQSDLVEPLRILLDARELDTVDQAKPRAPMLDPRTMHALEILGYSD